MTVIDIILLGIILIFVLTGIIRGFIKEIFGKVSVVAAIFFGIIFTPVLEKSLITLVKQPLLCKILSFLLIFVIVFLIVKIVQHILQKIFSGEILKGLDRTLGAVFGLLEGLVICYFIILVLEIMPFWTNIESYFMESFVYNLYNNVLPFDSFVNSENKVLLNKSA